MFWKRCRFPVKQITYLSFMKLIKKILIGVVIVFIAIQFFQPARNTSQQANEFDITKVVNVPENVQVLLKNACYDCHSNNTLYPWYSRVQPVGWFLASHIKDAKESLNFTEFAIYPQRKQQNKLEGITDEIRDNGMPLLSYRLMHKKARLSQSDKKLIIDWSQAAQDSLANKVKAPASGKQ